MTMTNDYDSYDEDEWAENEAALYFDEDSEEFVVAYGDGQVIGITIDNDEDRNVIRTVLSDVNFWTAFLGALGQAMQQVKKGNYIDG